MTRRPTIYAVAQRCGVSTATVSRVMSGGRGYSETTRKSVLAAAAELGWVPNGSARGLAANRAGIVGLLFPDLGKAADAESESALFVDQVIRGAEQAATMAGSAVLLAGTRGPAGRDLVLAVAAKVDGLVVVARALSARRLREISASVPVVVLSPLEAKPALDFVTADNRAAMRDLVAHLTGVHGYRDLAFIGGPSASPDSIERFRGFQDGQRDAGLTVAPRPHENGRFTEQGGADATERLLDSGRPAPRAIVAGNDEMAVGALTTLRRRELRVPTDVALTGFDDIATARHIRPALTTVRQPMREIGEQAVRVLLARIDAPDYPRHTVALPTTISVRRSCGCRPRPGRTSSAIRRSDSQDGHPSS